MRSDLAARTADIYNTIAERWDRERDKTLFERSWLDRVRAAIPRPASILDIGCGGGEPIAAYFIGHGHRLTGVDIAPAMLAMAARRFPQHTWIAADMRDLDLGQRFDAIIAFNSFFHLEPGDQPAMFPRFAAHLRRGGVLFFTAGPDAAEITGEVGGHTVYHASLAPDHYRRLMDRNGLQVLDFVADDPACRGHTLWLAQRQ